ncbi:MAG: molecular chaperone HtpG [Pseudoflavonifractor sp.]|nr:molecular chaperone HtpG [Alloprevotella sp.]MCM1116112.1 molecular chaperone HtpG [Pseudoflavonifractor sp.]
MSQQTGHIGVTTENIFPVIKKFLYSDHEIFLRELVSNAVDATQKIRTLSSFGEYKGELGDLKVSVAIDPDKGTLTVSDNGIGMTADDIDKYINQIAFSGAEEFLNKYKDTAATIIGHFGLGFYSAFMVAKKVEILSKSYAEGAEAVRWSCDGSPEYTMEPAEKAERGTDIILYIDDESKKFLDRNEIQSLLKKYCRFLPVPVVFGKEQEWKDGKMADTDRDNVVNNIEPAWTKKPAELTDADYLSFYHELYPGQDDPLFWIHLNVDYPFTLTGILYFPKIKNNFDVTRNRIQLYCNQVYVTDSVEGVVPEFMMLLQGVIDSPDIPLNVSRSYLQADTAVKKISGYITKKVASRLEELFKADRPDFEHKWDDIKIFIEYGMLTDEKFFDAAKKFALVKDTEGRYFTLDEYRSLVEAAQTDKDGNVVYLYTTDPAAQYSYIKAATERGYDVMIMDGQLDSHFVGLIESKVEKTRCVRVDSDVVDRLIPKADDKKGGPDLTIVQRDMLTAIFRRSTPKIDKTEFVVEFESVTPEANPVILTQNEYMRRMKEMAAVQGGMAFYGELPDSFNMIVNTEAPAIKRIKDEADKELLPTVEPLHAEIDRLNGELKALRDSAADGKLSDEQQGQSTHLEQEIASRRAEIDKKAAEWTDSKPLVKQVIDLALLANGLLKGEALSQFVNRSVSLL